MGNIKSLVHTCKEFTHEKEANPMSQLLNFIRNNENELVDPLIKVKNQFNK